MKIRVTSAMICQGQVRAANESFEVFNDVGQSLIDTGLAVLVSNDPPPNNQGNDPGNSSDANQQGGQEGTQPSNTVDEAALIEAYLKEHGTSVTNKSVIEALKAQGVVVQSTQVTAAKEKLNAAA